MSISTPTRLQLFGWQPDADPAATYNRTTLLSSHYGISDVAAPSSTSDPHYPSSSRRGHRNVVHDPSWVPRPRNAFIIFRCQYSREHGKNASGDDAKPVQTAKTISKKASEAWKQLSPSEADHYKQLAAQERDEHARKNPNYRFRPVKRHTFPPRNSGGTAGATGTLGIFDSKCPRHSAQNRSQGRFISPETERPLSPQPIVPISAGRRRFNSAPLLGSQSPLQASGEIKRAGSADCRPLNLPAWDELWYNLNLVNFLSDPNVHTPDGESAPCADPSATYSPDAFSFSQNSPQMLEPPLSNFTLPPYQPEPAVAVPLQAPIPIYSPTTPPTSLIGWDLDASSAVASSPAAELASLYSQQCPSESAQPAYTPTWECGMGSLVQNRGDVASAPQTSAFGFCSGLEQARALQAYEMGLKDFGLGAETPVFDGVYGDWQLSQMCQLPPAVAVN